MPKLERHGQGNGEEEDKENQKLILFVNVILNLILFTQI